MGQGYRLFKWCCNLSAGTVLHGCRMLKWCLNPPAGHCVAGVQAIKAVSEPTSNKLWGRGAGCLSNIGTYLPGTVLQGCSLFKQCRYLPPMNCGAGVQNVLAELEPTCRALFSSGVGFLSRSESTFRALCCRGAGC